MAVKFFGQYLVEKGVVSTDLLLKAIALQESTNLKFGEMAKAMGFVSEADITRVHDAQRTEDLQFGDMCVKLGILTAAQIQEILTKQKNSHLYIGEALVKVDALSAERLKSELDAFKADQAEYAVGAMAIPAGVSNAAIWEMCADLSYKMLSRIVNLKYHPGQCKAVLHVPTNDIMVSMRMTGSVNATYCVSVSNDIRAQIACAILHESDVSGESEAMLNDTVMEFVNIVCGNLAAKAAQMGKTLEIAPPVLKKGADTGMHVPEGGKILMFPIHSAAGRMEMSIIIE